MIVVTRLNESRFALNPDLIERIHEAPDTTLVTVDGARYIVTESMDEVIAMITEYRARVVASARSMPTGAQHPTVSPVPSHGGDARVVPLPTREAVR